MQRERVTEDILIFTSDLYAQVTAGLIVTSAGAILIDTLAFPQQETLKIKRFAEERLKTEVKILVNTHYHADHTMGNYLFPDAEIIAHRLCRDLLDTRGRESLERARETSSELRDVELRLPDTLFEQSYTLHLGNKTLQMWASPGHSPDSIVCLVEEDQILFAGDTMMSVPYFVDGELDDLVASLNVLKGHSFESIIQGHGEIILRGEVKSRIQSDLNYLETLVKKVDIALGKRDSAKALAALSLEACGKSRAVLAGAADQLHRNNVDRLARLRRDQPQMQIEQ